MRKFFVSVVTAVFFVLLGGLSLSQAADPEPSAYTLDNIYYYLAQGTEASWGAHSLEPQSGVPGDDIEGFTKSLEDIYYYMADNFSQCEATAVDVASGKTFFSTQSGNWGVKTGTLCTPIPTPTPTPTPIPTPTPWGYPDVIQIGSMYVASDKDGIGCASNGTKLWSAACSWGSGLDWLGKTDWRLPSTAELSTICSNKESLGSFQSGYYWSSSDNGPSDAWIVDFSGCTVHSRGIVHTDYVRAVRGGE